MQFREFSEPLIAIPGHQGGVALQRHEPVFSGGQVADVSNHAPPNSAITIPLIDAEIVESQHAWSSREHERSHDPMGPRTAKGQQLKRLGSFGCSRDLVARLSREILEELLGHESRHNATIAITEFKIGQVVGDRRRVINHHGHPMHAPHLRVVYGVKPARERIQKPASVLFHESKGLRNMLRGESHREVAG